MRKSLIVIFLVLLIDQISKFWIKTSMTIGESFPVLVFTLKWMMVHGYLQEKVL